ncbi:hypothetical protein [Bosea rubneri]|uniref:KTSC domain-containing protein n=1 Tax=Bosea rubneri TaxID=3075434 RepID=A0ABU3SF86_9HYPH|nr:hypothetical protein [Bosea sp. ZW T0_25]MDU0343458.1 hypothetical protein [Bosea sp. ZW T0_25]
MSQFTSLASDQPVAAQPTLAQPTLAQPTLAYVIEVGETQARLVARRAGERFFTFISAASAFDRLEGERFATPGAAERAARLLAAPRRQGPTRLAA